MVTRVFTLYYLVILKSWTPEPTGFDQNWLGCFDKLAFEPPFLFYSFCIPTGSDHVKTCCVAASYWPSLWDVKEMLPCYWCLKGV